MAAKRERVIFHVDMDAYFASVEQALNPHYRGKPVMVCGDPDRRSVVAAASYEARVFGIHAGMPVGEARAKCPHGLFVEGNPDRYVYYSLKMLEIFRAFTPRVEPYSIDEAFLDISDGVQDASVTPVQIAQQLKVRIAGVCESSDGEWALKASVGIAPNKLIAKMASGLSKPDGLTMLDEPGFRDTFWPLPVTEMWGVGEKSGAALARIGVRTVRDLAQCPLHTLRAVFGAGAAALREGAHGRDSAPVVPYDAAPDPKSVGHEYTLERDVTDRAVLHAHIMRLTQMVARRLRQHGFIGHTVTVKVRTRDFVTCTRQHRFHSPTDDETRIYTEALRLLHSALNGKAVRLLGVSVSDLSSAAGQAGNLFDVHDRRDKLHGVVDRLRDRYGDDILTTGDVLSLPRSGYTVIPPGDPRGRNAEVAVMAGAAASTSARPADRGRPARGLSNAAARRLEDGSGGTS